MAKYEKISEERKKLIQEFINQNNITTAKDIEEALKNMFKDTLQEMLEAEMTTQLGYDKYEYTDEVKQNYRNGYGTKNIHSSAGDFEIKVPRDRNGEFDPVIVEKNRSLESVYPIVFIDATYFNVKIEQSIVKRAVYIILGVNLNGEKEVLGFYISEVESAKQWANILNNLKNRGVKDILLLCADGLSGLKEAIGAVFPMVEFQRCIVHMIRNTVAYVSYKNRKELCSDLKKIYTAPDADARYENLLELQEKWEKRKVSLDNWSNNWDAIIPFFKFGPELRKIMYTTNAVESLNNSYKRINKGRRIFPSETSLEKSLYLATEIITERWTAKYQNWGIILRELRIHYGDRIPSAITI